MKSDAIELYRTVFCSWEEYQTILINMAKGLLLAGTPGQPPPLTLLCLFQAVAHPALNMQKDNASNALQDGTNLKTATVPCADTWRP